MTFDRFIFTLSNRVILNDVFYFFRTAQHLLITLDCSQGLIKISRHRDMYRELNNFI